MPAAVPVCASVGDCDRSTDEVPAPRVARPGLGETEVQDLDLALGGDLHVGGLEVAVDDALLVGGLERLGDLGRDLQGLVDRELAPLQPLGEVLAFDELQRQEGRALGLLESVDRGDVRVVEGGEKLGLPLEPGQPLGILGDLARQDLDGHVAVEVRVGGAVDLAHAPGAQRRRDAIVRESSTDHTGLLR